jgi:DNA-binding transcriptional MocR family regulator
VGVVDQLAAVVLVQRLDAILEERRRVLRERREALLAELAVALPGWTARRPAGGLSVWCELPPGTSSAALTAAAAPHGLVLAEGRAFGTGHAFDDHLRLPFTLPPDRLRTAVRLLAGVAAGLPSRGPAQLAPARPATVV